jgi:predicted nucleic acid-binding protein
MAETVRPRGSSAPVPSQHQQRILEFFENDYIRLRVIDRLIAKRSLSLCWNEGLHPRDALHVAVALEEKCEILETTDPRLIRLNGLEGMEIRYPYLEEQTDWADGT